MPIIRMVANKGVLRVFFALISVVAIMFLSNYLVFRNSISGIYGQVNENNRLVVKNIIASFEDCFREINELMYTIHTSPYSAWDSTEGQIDMHQAYLMQKNLAKIVPARNYVEEVIAFYGGSDLAITSKGTIQLQDLFARSYKHDMYTANYWKSMANTKHSMLIYPADVYREDNGGYGARSKKMIAVMGSNRVELSNANIMVLIHLEGLLDYVDLKTLMPGSGLTVLDQEENLIFSTENFGDWRAALGELNQAGSNASVTLDGFEYSVFRSEYNGFIYLNKTPYQFLNMGPVAKANRIIMFIAIMSAVVLSIFLSIYLYRPVKNILKLFGGRYEEGTEFRRIYRGILDIQSENASILTQMDFLNSEIRRGVFLHSLDEYSHTPEFERQMQKYFSDFFQNKNFVMAGFFLQPKAGEDERASLRIEDLTERLNAELSERVGSGQVLFHAGELKFLALIGAANPAQRDLVVKKLRSLYSSIQNEWTADYEVLGAVSRLYPSRIENCHKAYKDLSHALSYRRVDSGPDLVDSQTLERTYKIHFPLEDQEKLVHLLTSGNSQEAASVVGEFISRNEELGIHHHQMVSVAKQLFFLLLKHLELRGGAPEDLAALELDFCRKAETAVDFAGIRKELERLAREAANHIEPNKNKLNAGFIADYIEQHYMDNLYIDHMAELCHTTPKYFSNYFKKAFGVTFVDYLNRVRLTSAKQLLKSTDLPVAEIGGRTGYANSTTFTTTFKKYYGLSPSEYRKQNLE